MLCHEAPENEHARERERARSEIEHAEKLLIESEYVDRPPREAGAGRGNRAQNENDDRRADQRFARLRIEDACESRDEKRYDREGTDEYDLLVVREVAKADGERENDESDAAAEDPPIGRRRGVLH